MTTTKRLKEFDIAKGICILLVIVNHLGIKEISSLTVFFTMPSFYLISGYFLSESLDLKSFCFKLFKRLIIPYVVTCLAICLLSVPVSILFEQNVTNNLIKWVCGSIYGSGSAKGVIPGFPSFIGALWFLEALFWGLLITRFILTHSCNKKFTPLLILTISYIGYATALKSWLPLNIQSGCVAAGFIYLGYLARKHMSIVNLPPVSIFLILIVLWCKYYYKGFYLNRNYFGNGWMDIIGALAAVYLLILFCKIIILKIGFLQKILQWYGENSLIVLAFHIIELDLIPKVKVLGYLSKLGISSDLALFYLFLCKLLWVTLGILMINRISILRRVYK